MKKRTAKFLIYLFIFLLFMSVIMIGPLPFLYIFVHLITNPTLVLLSILESILIVAYLFIFSRIQRRTKLIISKSLLIYVLILGAMYFWINSPRYMGIDLEITQPEAIYIGTLYDTDLRTKQDGPVFKEDINQTTHLVTKNNKEINIYANQDLPSFTVRFTSGSYCNGEFLHCSRIVGALNESTVSLELFDDRNVSLKKSNMELSYEIQRQTGQQDYRIISNWFWPGNKIADQQIHVYWLEHDEFIKMSQDQKLSSET